MAQTQGAAENRNRPGKPACRGNKQESAEDLQAQIEELKAKLKEKEESEEKNE